MKLQALILLSTASLVLAGCTTGTSDAESDLPNIPLVEDTVVSGDEETSSDEILDKLTGIENDLAIVNELVSLNNASCDKANQVGVVETSENGFLTSFIIPESERLFDVVGYHLIEDEIYMEIGSSAFSVCSVASLAKNSEVAYGEPLGHIKIEKIADNKFSLSAPWIDISEIHEYIMVDGLVRTLNIFDLETGEFLADRSFNYEVSDEDIARYVEYIEQNSETSQ